LMQAVEQAAVEVESALVGAAGALRLDPGPGDGEPVRPQAQFLHEVEVLDVPVVVVERDVAGVAAAHPSRRVAEGVPNRLAATVLFRRSFDLVRRGRRAPAETLGEPQAKAAFGI